MLEQERKAQESGLKSLSHLKDQLKDVKSTKIVTVFHGQCARKDCCTIHEYRLEVDQNNPLRDGDYAHKKDIKNASSVNSYGKRSVDERISELRRKK